ncbi:hypothetical protein HHK36_021054 [Tetracentron sinense]|uniref:Proline-rich protein PRCC n=1 Tax=Tetracentron sinense TaxID=13715 RepID=A0A834YQU1_TETSI|nr:hypothetical protein HHK36_021054 [Tetracentron sinense]
MDSLLANYASSDEEEEDKQQQLQKSGISSKPTSNINEPSSNFSGLRKTSSIFKSLPQPKSTSLVSSLPPPKSHHPKPKPPTNLSSSDLNPKRVVKFKPPLNPHLLKSGDLDDDDDDEEEKERKATKELISSSAQTSSLKSFFSSLPAPKNSLGLGAPPSLGSGRRSIIETDVPTSNSDGFRAENEEGTTENLENYGGNWVDGSSSALPGTVDGHSEFVASGGDSLNYVPNNENYDNYGSYGNYGEYGNYESNWIDKSEATMPEMSGMVESVLRIPGKRGRTEIPLEIIEVKQDELIKNRPREDQVKLTGIAFGPSYQPVSTKGKPSKLHKRKHQIGSLYFDMRQKETELAERRSKGFLTKAETQAKYGW